MHSTRAIRTLALGAVSALVAGTALLGPATPAHAAATVIVEGASSVSLGYQAVSTNFTVTIGGTATDFQVSVQAIKTVGKKSPLPTVAAKPALVVDQPLSVSLNLPNTTAPGRYQLTVQALEGATVVGTTVAAFDVNASLLSTVSLVKTGKIYYHYGTSKVKVVWAGPTYLKGAKLSFYYQKPGKTAFSKLGSKKINSKGKVTFKTKKAKLVRGAAYQVRVTSRPYAPSIVIPNTFQN
jgi:hypothetical protein